MESINNYIYMSQNKVYPTNMNRITTLYKIKDNNSSSTALAAVAHALQSSSLSAPATLTHESYDNI